MKDNPAEPRWAAELSELAEGAVEELQNRLVSAEFQATSKVATFVGFVFFGMLIVSIGTRSLGAMLLALGLFVLLCVVCRHLEHIKNACLGRVGHLWVSRFASSTFLVDPHWPERLGRASSLPKATMHHALLDCDLGIGAFETASEYRNAAPRAKTGIEVPVRDSSKLGLFFFRALPGSLLCALSIGIRGKNELRAATAVLGIGFLVWGWRALRRHSEEPIAQIQGDEILFEGRSLPVRSIIALELRGGTWARSGGLARRGGLLRVWVHRGRALTQYDFPQGQRQLFQAILRHPAFRRPASRNSPALPFVEVG